MPVLLVLAGLTAAVLAQGGYYGAGQRVVTVLLVAAAATGGARSFRAPTRRSTARACAALATWSVVSAVLAGDGAGALSTVLVLAGVIVVIGRCHRLDARQRDQVTVAVVVLGLTVALTGWAGVAWHGTPWALVDQGLWRAASTLTYANATGGLLAAIVLLCLARFGSSASVPAAAAGCLLLTGLGATLSRGGLVAFLAGAVVLAWALGPRVALRGAAAPALGALVALGGLWPSIPSDAPARPALAAAALVAGLLVAGATARLALRPLLASGGAGVLMLVVLASGPMVDATRRISGPRFSVASTDRAGEARAALRSAAGRPLTGVGPGNAELSWDRSDGAVLVARFAHNEYLQTLAELGVVGLVLLLTLLAAIGRDVRRACPPAVSPPLRAGVAAGLVALGVHGLLDFGWHLPAIWLTGALLVGIATTNQGDNQA